MYRTKEKIENRIIFTLSFKMILDLLIKYNRFIKYCIIGIIGVFLDFIMFLLLTEKLHIYYQYANVVSVTVGIINNFLLNAFFNFKTKDKLFSRFIQFYSVGSLGILISAFLFYIFVEQLRFEVISTKVAIVFIVAVIQYVLNKTFTFRGSVKG